MKWFAVSLACCCALVGAQSSEEEQRTFYQEPLALYEASATTAVEDTGQALTYFLGDLFLAGNTEGAIEEANEGGSDIVFVRLDPEDLSEKARQQFGGDGNDTVYSITSNTITTDIVVVGATRSSEVNLFDNAFPAGVQDWFIALLDAQDLSLNDFMINGTEFEDQGATAVGVDSNGRVVVAGYTWGDYFDVNAGSANDASSIGFDVFVFKIDADLEEIIWGIQWGTAVYDVPSALVIGSDDKIYVLGTSTDLAGVATDDEVDNMFVLKIGSGGVVDCDTCWQTTFGLESDSGEAHGLVLSEDETELYVAGNTRGDLFNWTQGDASRAATALTGKDELFLVSLSTATGEHNWVYQSSANASSYGTAGVALAADGSPIIGGYAFGNHFDLLVPDYWVEGSGDIIAVKIDPETLNVSRYFVGHAASNLTTEIPLAMLQDPDVEDGVFLAGVANGAFETLDVHLGQNDMQVLKVELEELPEEEDEVDDDDEEEEDGPSDKPFDYWVVAVALAAVLGLGFVGAYKWSAHSVAAREAANKLPSA